MENFLFDTHAHLDDERFDMDREDLIEKLKSSICKIINAGCDIKTSEISLELAKKHDFIYATVGFHPHEAQNMTDEAFAKIEEMAKHPKVVAIGEIGLDYYYDSSPRETQKKVFEMQMELAEKLSLPVVIHDRDAHADCMSIIRKFPNVRGTFHCFAGSLEMANELIKLGYNMSFGGALTFKNAVRAVNVVENIGMEHIMLETDCPYLTPVPHRGKRNDPSYTMLVAEKIAQLKNLSVEEVIEITYNNAINSFKIG